MTALAGFWSLDGRPDWSRQCEAMIVAQSSYGIRTTTGELGTFAFAARISHFLPEDAIDSQPVVGGAGRLALVADLRLDNRPELFSDLGLNFTSGSPLSDAALLLLALERWGEDAVTRLLGDFAFAFYDAQARKLLLARDPLGQRPLFWHRDKAFAAFSSMPAGLHALSEIAKQPDESALIGYLASLPRSGPNSFYKGVERVEPGHLVTITPESTSRQRYWQPRRRELRLKRFEDYVDAYRAELDAAVARRLRGAGGAVAAHLSGGWDSNAAAATAARLLALSGGRVIAYTHAPRDMAPSPSNRLVDETSLASATARLYPNMEHVIVPSSRRSPTADLDLYARIFERPVFNLCNHVWLSEIRVAANAAGAPILLSGEIGNWTISAGPGSLLADLLREGRWLAWSRAAWGQIRHGGARLRGVAANSFGPWVPNALWSRVARFAGGERGSTAGPLHPDLRVGLSEQIEANYARPKNYFEDAADALLGVDWGEHRKGILGGWGIDKRDPTADIRLVDFCLSLPIDMLMKGNIRRPLARTALSDRVALAVLNERRKGYQSPDWYVGLSKSREQIVGLLDAMAADPTASRLINVDWLRGLVRNWPDSGWQEPRIIREYRVELLRAITAGHFILAARR